jgi:hypothetical protein
MATYITKPSYYNVIGGFKPSVRESGLGGYTSTVNRISGSRTEVLKLQCSELTSHFGASVFMGSTWFRLEKESIRIQVVGSYLKGIIKNKWKHFNKNC